MADISIIAPNFNNGRFLDDFIRSIVNSTYVPKELIIIDDGSTDDSLNILQKYNDLPFLKVITFGENKGLPSALNAGIDAANGKYIMRADPDDMLLPHRIQAQFNFMESHPEIDICGANVLYFNNISGRIVNSSNFPPDHKNIVKAYQRGEHGLQHPTVIGKSTVYKKYKYQAAFPGEDYEIYSRMVVDGRSFANLKSPVNKMRIHTSSLTTNLTYNSIRKTFKFRDQIFKTKTSNIIIIKYFLYIKNYRKSQISRFLILKYFYLFLASICYPSKIIRRFSSFK